MLRITALAAIMFSTSAITDADSIDPPRVTTIVGTGKPDFAPNNIGQPFGVEWGPDNALYITEVSNHRVLRFDPKTRALTTVAGSGAKGYMGDGRPAVDAALNEPYEVRFDREGNMFFVEMKNHLIRRVDRATGIITTVAGTGKPGFSGDGGPPKNAAFRDPHSIAFDQAGHLYVADIGNHRIRRIDLKADRIETIVGNGQRKLPTDGVKALNHPIAGPRALYVQHQSLWIALREGHSVWRYDLAGKTLHHVAGTGKPGYTGDNGPAKKATFNGPKGIVLDREGNIYLVDTENQVIRKIEARTNVVYTIAGAGPRARGFAGDDGPPQQAYFDRPHGIGLAPDGRIFIGDTNNHRVRMIR